MKNITISSVEVVNFMCHSNLRINFEKMITCIGGRNGSGKSAIMMALGVVFGQKAKELDRGHSFKNFIKTGTNQATVKVVINNHRKYNMERYGEYIIIEKKIREKGTKLSIANKFGKIFKIKTCELEGIIEAYKLKFDNPLNFLTQETSKKFLNISSPKDLYDFYYQGTEFKNLDDDLDKGKILLDELDEKLSEASKQLELVENKIEECNAELKRHTYDPEAVLKKLQNEENWLKITEENKKLDGYILQIKEFDEQRSYKENDREEKMSVVVKNYTEVSTTEKENELAKIKVNLHSVTEEIKEYTEEKESVEKAIENAENKNNVDQLANEMSKIKRDKDNIERCLKEAEEGKDKAYEKMQTEQQTNSTKQEKAYTLKKQIEYLKANALDQVKSSTYETVRKIKGEMRKQSFKDEVIGPIYEFIELKEQRWYKVASIVLRKSLTNFIVFNNEDKNKLYEIFNQLGADYSVSQMKSKQAYTSLNINKGFKTLLDVLDVHNPVVSNQIITLFNIEQIVLMDDREEAHRVIIKNPKHVDCAYIRTGDKIKLSNGALTDFRQRDDGNYWFEDKTTKIDKLETELAELKYEDTSKREYNEIMHEIGRLTKLNEDYEKKHNKLGFQYEALTNLKGSDTDDLLRKLKVINKTLSVLNNKKTELASKLDELNKSITEIYKANLTEKENIKKLKEQYQSDIANIDRELMFINNRRGLAVSQMKQTDEQIKAMQTGADKKPENIRDIGSINKERRVAMEFREIVKNMRPKEELVNELKMLEAKKRTLETVKMKFTSSFDDTSKTYEKRLEKKEEIKNKNTKEAMEAFKSYTSRSGYEGVMEIDHEHRFLDLKMKVHNSAIAGSKNTLSGGERSFAGVCFLLSMWRCFKCPVKVLDEFDVFMDSLNRKTIIRSIFEFFKDNDTQVILITPLDTSDLNDPDCDIKQIKKNAVD